jgi:hypothetical protein
MPPPVVAPPPPPPSPPPKPRYAPDPARRGALIASSLAFGLGTLATGTAYLTDVADCDEGCGRTRGAPATLYALGGFLTLPPSIPRLVVGDYAMAALYTGLRGVSFAVGTLVDWEDDSYTLPVTFAFAIPVTLGIIDLATTPHREQLNPAPPRDERAGVELHGIGPTATVDSRGELAPAVGAMGAF